MGAKTSNPQIPAEGGAGARVNRVTLDDKYDLTKSRVFVSGTQALVRMMLMQKERDRRAGLNTAGYVTGYRGSPLGGLDQQFMRAAGVLNPNDIVFQPGVNEDLAATALWGSQQAEMRGEGRFDGVFGMWYGKGPGVDRSGDVFRHANFAGTSPHGGVLALMGDDHTCESSTTAHQSEFAFVDVMMPILNPAGVQELIDYGLYGYALSRYAGVWTALKGVKDTVESTASIDGSLDRVSIVIPDDYAMPPDGLNIRPNDHPLEQEARLHDHKRYAMLAFLRANKLDRMIFRGGRGARIGVVSLGKSHLDVMQALADLGIDEVKAARLGLRVYKLASPWPLESGSIETFADGLKQIIVVEEKRMLVEAQIREQLYGRANAPGIIGKRDEHGEVLFAVKGALDSNDIAIAIGERVLREVRDEALQARVAELRAFQKTFAETASIATRTPYFCAGCPHNSSTLVPEGSRAYAGIGCHYMVQWMDRDTEGYTHMGGEGANWIGEAPFSNRDHVFQNLGDGTYNHSGYMAIRAAKAAGVNITYKILYNDAVAMTGGQAHEGNLTVPEIAAQVAAEGANPVVVVTDEPDKYPAGTQWPTGTTVRHRDELNDVQASLREVPGLSVIIYDQTCAAEKRRRRKRGLYPDPDERVVINELVCEGCGDCGVQSNCVAIAPVETEFGRKRQIDQSACNKDFSCVKGFCPSFVTVKGGQLKRAVAAGGGFEAGDLPQPERSPLDRPYGIVVTGVGGTGVVTIGALIGMAAHLEGKGCGIIDMAGLAQKGGSVMSHLQIAEHPDDIATIRVAAGGADLVLGCDIVVAGGQKVLAAVNPGTTQMVVNTHEQFPGDFTHDVNYALPTERLKRAIRKRAGADHVHMVDATGIATKLFADSIMANIFMLGFACQLGRIPVSIESIEEAIRMNGQTVPRNLAAFAAGRSAAHDPRAFARHMQGLRDAATSGVRKLSGSLEELIERRVEFLADYQDMAYALRFEARVERMREAEAAALPGSTRLTETVTRGLFKVMAYKDEYEVARLYTDGSFARQVASRFDGKVTLNFHLAPPLLARPDPRTGAPAKLRFGGWMMTGFRLLAPLKRLRGTPFDIFGYTEERRAERQLVLDYEAMVDELIAGLTEDNFGAALRAAGAVQSVRGFGHVKAANLAAARIEWEAALDAFRDPPAPLADAAE